MVTFRTCVWVGSPDGVLESLLQLLQRLQNTTWVDNLALADMKQHSSGSVFTSGFTLAAQASHGYLSLQLGRVCTNIYRRLLCPSRVVLVAISCTAQIIIMGVWMHLCLQEHLSCT